MTPWKYTDAARVIVGRILDDGSSVSCFASRDEVRAWVAAGNTILDPDPPPPPTQDQLDTAAAQTYQKLVALRGMTPAQVQAWVDANVTDLASARDAIKTLAVFACVMARRL